MRAGPVTCASLRWEEGEPIRHLTDVRMILRLRAAFRLLLWRGHAVASTPIMHLIIHPHAPHHRSVGDAEQCQAWREDCLCVTASPSCACAPSREPSMAPATLRGVTAPACKAMARTPATCYAGLWVALLWPAQAVLSVGGGTPVQRQRDGNLSPLLAMPAYRADEHAFSGGERAGRPSCDAGKVAGV